MAILCLTYFAVIGAAFGLVALLVERMLGSRAERRWVWLGAMVVSVLVPVLSSAHHSTTSVQVFGFDLLQLAAGSASGLNPGWFVCATPLGAMIMKGWGIATLLLVSLGVIATIRTSRCVRRLPRDASASIDGVSVLVSDNMGPAAVGVWRTQILLPAWVLAMPSEQRRFIVRHEQEHQRAHDVRLLVAGACLVCLMPWNIALWWQLHRLRLGVELDCDQRVIAALGDARGYGKLLLRIAQSTTRRQAQWQPALLGRAGSLERRLLALVAPSELRLGESLLIAALVAAVIFGVLAVPHPVPSLPDIGGVAHAH